MRNFKRLFIIITGFVILLAGIVMVFLPGPGLLFILLGLGILAQELAWAREILTKIKNKIKKKSDKASQPN